MMPRYNSFYSLLCLPLMMVAFIDSVQATSLRNIEKFRQPESTIPEESKSPEVSHDERQELVERKLGCYIGNFSFRETEFLHAYMEDMDELESSNAFAGVTIEYGMYNKKVMNINYYIQGGPSSCKNCLVAIHRGTNCSWPKGRYFQKTYIVQRNPWTKRNGAVAVTDNTGEGYGWIDGINNGYTLEENVDHVVMIYDGFRLNSKNKRRAKAKPIACGVLKRVVS